MNVAPQFNLEEIEPYKKKVSVTLSPADFKKKLDGAIAKLSTQVNLKGFRKGKAPQDLVRKMYGEGAKSQLIDDLTQEYVDEAVKQHDLKVGLLQELNQVNASEQDGFSFTFEAVLEPEVALPKYDGVELTVEKVKATEQYVQNVIERTRKSYSRLQELKGDETAKEQDIVSFKIHGEAEGTSFSETAGFSTISKSEWGTEIDKALTGAKVGDTVNYKATATDRFPEEVRGKLVTGTITIEKMYRFEAPELTEENIAAFGTTSVAEFKDRCKAELEGALDAELNAKKEQAMIDLLLAGSKFEVHEAFTSREVQGLLYEKATTEDEKHKILHHFKIAEHRTSQEYKDAEKNIRVRFILDALVKDQNVQINSEELTQHLITRAQQMRMTGEQVRKEFSPGSPRLREETNFVVRSKALNEAVAKAKVAIKEIEPDAERLALDVE